MNYALCRTVAENLGGACALTDVIRPADDPYRPDGGIATLWDNLASEGAVVKAEAVRPEMMQHRDPARILDSEEAALDVTGSLCRAGRPGQRRCNFDLTLPHHCL
ncbi:MAG TPA: dihydroxy-acid dehydratase [Thermoflexia bacterium]|nr:dihydroxy-acid dehydratase [Thermoflexia bacterium]